MIMHILFVLFLSCMVSSSSWFPPLQLSSSSTHSTITHYSLTSTYKSCKTESSQDKYIPLFKSTPASIVMVGQGLGIMDIKFKNGMYVLNQEIDLDDENPCLIIPPYQPVEWMRVEFQNSFDLCSYYDNVEKGEKTSNEDCKCSEVMAKHPQCKLANIPHTISKPENEFFLTAEVTPEANDVTACTFVLVDQLSRLDQMSEYWGGPISAAVYLQEKSDIGQVMEWWLSNPLMRKHVDIHLVEDDKIYPFGSSAFPASMLANVAVRFARTANVFYVESDFIPSPDLYPNLDEVRERLAEGEKSVFIVAPFIASSADFDMGKFPKDKAELQDIVKGTSPPIQDLSNITANQAFDYSEWFKMKSNYKGKYSTGYEPYYIGPKSYPLFEEILTGCGAAKASHAIELSTAGYAFHVIATGFILRIDSNPTSSICKNEDKGDTLQWEAFNTRISHIYSSKAQGNFDSRVPWWDLAPVIGVKQSSAPQEDVCFEPPPKEEKQECPPCQECAACSECKPCPPRPPATMEDCQWLNQAHDEYTSKKDKRIDELEQKVKALQQDNDSLSSYSKHVTNLSIGTIVVMVVVIGVGICVWPRGKKKVWSLPTWKSTHHSL